MFKISFDFSFYSLVTYCTWVCDAALYAEESVGRAGKFSVCKCCCPEHTVAQGTHWIDAATVTLASGSYCPASAAPVPHMLVSLARKPKLYSRVTQ